MPYILPKQQAIFFHIPRTGGATIREWLMKNTECIRVQDHLNPWYSVMHKVISRKIIKEYKKFTFVRNPWARLVSAWEFRLSIGAERYLVADNFEDYVKYYYAKQPLDKVANIDGIIMPQHVDVFNEEDSELNIEVIGRIENIQKDFNKMCKSIDILPGKLDHINKSKSKGYPHYSTYYTDETKQMATEIYAKDIELLEYEFEDYANF